MTLTRYDRHGFAFTEDDFASAEALIQARPVEESVKADKNAVWMPDPQRLEKDSPLERLPASARTRIASLTVDEAILHSLANDPDVYVRWRVAENEATPAEVREALARKGVVGRLVDVAKNVKSPTALATLASDPSFRVRENVARDTSTPSAALAMLANDPYWTVRDGVAKNVSAPATLLAILATDPDPDVQDAAKKNPNYDPSLPVPRKP